MIYFTRIERNISVKDGLANLIKIIENTKEIIIRINKRLILFMIKEEYPSLYETLRKRAERTTNYAIGGIF